MMKKRERSGSAGVLEMRKKKKTGAEEEEGAKVLEQVGSEQEEI